MTSFVISINAVLPFLVYLGFGFSIKKLGLADEAFLNHLNKVVFSALFPFTMFYNIHNLSINLNDCLLLVLLCITTLAAVILLSFVIVCALVKENAKRGVIIQAIYRSNIVLYALPLTENLFSQKGAAFASILVAICVPIYNVVAIIILEYFNGKTAGIKSLISKVLHNPLFQGAAVGILFAAFHIQLPDSLENTVKTISGLTTPLALMVLGGTTKLSSIKNHIKYLVPVLTFKMLILPAITLFIGSRLGLDSVELFIYFILFATPIAVGSYSMAENMGGDGKLAGEFVSISTVISIITLFLWILFLTSSHMI
jgi:predicted permease